MMCQDIRMLRRMRGESIGEPPAAANPGYRSGIGLISGWVCEANEVDGPRFRVEEWYGKPFRSRMARAARMCP